MNSDDTRVHRRRSPICSLTVSARKQWLAAKHFCEDATDTPDIDRARVLLEGEHDFGCAIPPVGSGKQGERGRTKIVKATRLRAWRKRVSDSAMTDEGRTDLVATYSVMKVLLSLATFGGGRAERARPKSQS